MLPNYLSKFHKYGSYNFFSKQTTTFGYPPPPPCPVRICPLLPDPPPYPNVQTSSMDGPFEIDKVYLKNE